MSLESAMKGLSLRPSTLCQQCRRAFASSSLRRQEQQRSATASFADSFRSTTDTPRQPTQRATTPSTLPPRTSTSTTDFASDLVRQAAGSPTARAAREAARQADLERSQHRMDLDRQVSRRWKAGDVYAPHDLSGAEMSKWKKVRKPGRRARGTRDVVDNLGIDFREVYKNFSIMSEYMSEMGRIKHSNETSLRPVNQRKMAKAIRRAIGIGLMPGVHRHPELLRLELQNRRARGQ